MEIRYSLGEAFSLYKTLVVHVSENGDSVFINPRTGSQIRVLSDGFVPDIHAQFAHHVLLAVDERQMFGIHVQYRGFAHEHYAKYIWLHDRLCNYVLPGQVGFFQPNKHGFVELSRNTFETLKIKSVNHVRILPRGHI